jgi:iron complex outermembrane receptor protein
MKKVVSNNVNQIRLSTSRQSLKRFNLSPLSAAITIAFLGTTFQVSAQEAGQETKPAVAANAKSTTEQQPVQLETIVVTANKRIEVLEKVPMAISVMNESLIQRNDIREIEDVIALMPALTISSGTTAANNVIFMRGIGTISVGVGVESDVSVIIDDIPVAAQYQAFKDLADVSRIEVLKGPQSTLFGKSSVAGAINIVTKPIGGPIVTRGGVYFTNDGEKRIKASIGGKISDTLGLRLAASKTDFPGLLHNLTTGENVGGSSGKAFVAKVSWKPTSDLDIDFSPKYSATDNTKGVTAINAFKYNSGTNIGQLATIDQAYFGGRVQLPGSVLLAGINPNDPKNLNVRRDYLTGLFSTDFSGGLKIAYALPDGSTLMSISSFDRYKANDYRDQDFTDKPTLALPGSTAFVAGNTQAGTYDIKSKTQEIRLVSPDSGAFRYLAGLWWAKSDTQRQFIRGLCTTADCQNGIPTGNATSPVNYTADLYSVTKAVFGQATWDLSSDYTVLGGLRFNEEKSGNQFVRSFRTDLTPENLVPAEPVANNKWGTDSNVDRAVTGKLSLQRQFSKEWMGYVMAATGYKGVAYDVLSSATIVNSKPTKPETSKTIEIGFKGNLFENRMTVNGTFFNTNFHDYQQTSTTIDVNTGGVISTLNSVPQVRTSGFELDTSMLITPNFNLNASFAYTLPKIVEWTTGPCYSGQTVAQGCTLLVAGKTNTVQNLSGGYIPGTPKVSLAIGGQYDFAFENMPFSGFINGNVKYKGRYNTNLNNDPTLVNDPVTITDLGFGIKGKNDAYRIAFRVNNLFDRFYLQNANVGGPATNYRGGPTTTSPQIQASSWVPGRDVFRYFSLSIDFKY